MTATAHHSLFGPALRGIFAALGSDVAQKILGLAATLIILSALKPYEYGLWQLVLSVLTAFDVLLFPSIGSMLIADVSREIGAGRRNRAGAIVVRAVPAFLFLGMLAVVGMVISASFVTKISGIDLTVLLWIVSVALIGEGVMQCYQLVFQGTLALVHAQALKMFKRFCYFISIGVLVFWFEAGLMGIAFAYALSLLIPVIFYAPLALSRFRLLVKGREGGHGHFLEAVWGRGRWSVSGELLATGVASAWPWIIGYYLSVADVGYISVANMILGQVASLAPISFVLRSVLPRTLGVEGRTRAWLVRSMKYAIWSQVLGGLVMMVAVYFFIPLLYPAYVVVVSLVAVLLITLPIRAVGTVASEWFFALRRQRSLFFVSNLPKLFLIALLPPLLAWWGMFGFVVYTLISTEMLTFLRLRLIARDQGGYITLREMLVPDAEDAKVLQRSFEAFMQMRASRK